MTDTPAIFDPTTPSGRVYRTIRQWLVSIAVVVPVTVGALVSAGVGVPSASALIAIAGIGQVVVTALENYWKGRPSTSS